MTFPLSALFFCCNTRHCRCLAYYSSTQLTRFLGGHATEAAGAAGRAMLRGPGLLAGLAGFASKASHVGIAGWGGLVCWCSAVVYYVVYIFSLSFFGAHVHM